MLANHDVAPSKKTHLEQEPSDAILSQALAIDLNECLKTLSFDKQELLRQSLLKLEAKPESSHAATALNRNILAKIKIAVRDYCSYLGAKKTGGMEKKVDMPFTSKKEATQKVVQPIMSLATLCFHFKGCRCLEVHDEKIQPLRNNYLRAFRDYELSKMGIFHEEVAKEDMVKAKTQKLNNFKQAATAFKEAILSIENQHTQQRIQKENEVIIISKHSPRALQKPAHSTSFLDRLRKQNEAKVLIQKEGNKKSRTPSPTDASVNKKTQSN